jgi:hypothetical protein
MKVIEALLFVIGLIVLSAIIMAFPTMWLWNYLMPDIFGITEITLYQAMAINFLSGILFRSNINVKKN